MNAKIAIFIETIDAIMYIIYLRVGVIVHIYCNYVQSEEKEIRTRQKQRVARFLQDSK